MTDQKAQKTGKKGRKSLCGKGKYQRYRGAMRREKHHLKRVLCSSGIEAARAYGARVGMPAYATELINKLGARHRPFDLPL